MQFLWQSLLWSLWIIPILLAVYVLVQRRRRRFALRYSDVSVIRAARVPVSHWRHLPAALLLLALTTLLVALARPQITVVVAEPSETVILTIDVSESMGTADIQPTRIEAAKTAARTFVQGSSPGARIGVVAFSTTASIVQTPTRDHDAVVAAINRLNAEGSTAIGSGILVSLNAIFGDLAAYTGEDGDLAAPGVVPSPGPQRASISLLTDGANIQGPSPQETAQKAAELGVRIFAIGVGKPNARASTGEGSGGSRGADSIAVDPVTLTQVARVTGGEYYLAQDAETLVGIYKKLETEIVLFTEQMEITPYVSAAALVLLLAAAGLSTRWSTL